MEKDNKNSEIAKKEKTEEQKKEIEFGINLRLAKSKNTYIINIVNGRYFLARCNMIAKQLLPDADIVERLDGALKTEEYVRAEYAHQKIAAITNMRNAHFAKQELMKEFKLTEEDIVAIETDYYDGKIIREEYDEIYKKGSKAEFVNSRKD